jgi:hypothetical protein
MALEMATSARQESDTEEARHREDRLRLRLRGGKAARLNLTAHISV